MNDEIIYRSRWVTCWTVRFVEFKICGYYV